jgi:Bacterial Ig domain
MKKYLVLLGLTLLLTATSWAQSLLDINFGAGIKAPKTGFAATGVNTNDYWNFYTRDDGHGGWNVNGALPNLKYVDGTVSGAGLTVNNGPGAWDNGSTDIMYDDYIYPLGPGNLVASVTNLPAGNYDVYVYSQDGNYTLNVGGTSYGTKSTRDVPLVNPPVWQEGKQYALFHSVSVAAGEALTLTVSNGVDGFAIVAGMQIAPNGLNRPPSPNTVSLGTLQNKPISVPFQKLMSSTTDSDGDAVTLTGIKTNSATGASIILAAGSATYVPNTNFTGVDYFTYSVTDAKGAKSSGYVIVDVRPANVAFGQMLPPVPAPDGGFNVSFMGMPGRTYNLQRSTSLNGPWTTLTPITVDLSGVGVYRDANPPKAGAFYRTVY